MKGLPFLMFAPNMLSQSFYTLESLNLQGQPFLFEKLRGKVVLVVNIASKCGFTPQLGELEKLYLKWKDKGLEIVAFPCNQFLFQEPLTGSSIQDFCSLHYNVTFPIMEKTKVRGFAKHEVYQYLTEKEWNGSNSTAPWWNFYKYLIDKNGELQAVYGSKISPISTEMENAIANLITT